MFYNYNYWGMNIIWWVIWMIMIFWIFVTPWDIPGQRKQKDTPLDILQQRYAMGQMTTEEYKERKRILGEELADQQRINNSKKVK
jgi:putative membrane protein